MQLVEAKIDAAQYAFEREEAVQRLQAVTKKAEMSQGGGMKLAQQLTAMEVRHEDRLLHGGYAYCSYTYHGYTYHGYTYHGYTCYRCATRTCACASRRTWRAS